MRIIVRVNATPTWKPSENLARDSINGFCLSSIEKKWPDCSGQKRKITNMLYYEIQLPISILIL